MSKKKLLFMFLILSFVPFLRGCDFTFGFPFPVSGFVLNSSVIPQSLVEPAPAIKLIRLVLFLLANISLLYVIAVIIRRKIKSSVLLSSFSWVLSFNLLLNYLLYLFSLIFKEEVRQPIVKSLLQVYLQFVYYYLYWVPSRIQVRLRSLLNIRYEFTDILEDIYVRAWFVIVTVVLGILVYSFRKRRAEKALK